jgi:site-specific recombinase XerC
VPGVKQAEVRVGNWLVREQASELLNAPNPETLGGKRDRAILALVVGCGLRLAEILSLEVGQIRQREGRRVLPNLVGKGKRRRTVPVPAAVKVRIEEWCSLRTYKLGSSARDEGRQAGWRRAFRLKRRSVHRAEICEGDVAREAITPWPSPHLRSSAGKPAAISNRFRCSLATPPFRLRSGTSVQSRT